MINILYNISLVLIGYSLLLYFTYFLKLLKRKSNNTIYDVRPNQVFNKMFISPPILKDYEDLDQNDPVYKLFVKN